jgi:hypothetical protein
MISLFSLKLKKCFIHSTFAKVSIYKYKMLQRNICPICRTNPVTVNYVKNGVTHYRNCCAPCKKHGRKLRPVPLWAKSGYKKKERCELCNFKFKLTEQSNVYYVDGDLKNNNWTNLKTVCLNCQQELFKNKISWKPSPIVPDF